MRRQSFKVPGWDCRVECTHEPKGEHGVHCEEWIYAVTTDDGSFAVALTVFTENYPPTVDPSSLHSTRGADLSTHAAFPFKREHHLPDAQDEWKPCGFVDGHRCIRYGTTSLGARRFFQQHGSSVGFEQSESFWRALEGYLASEYEGAATARDEAARYARCSSCEGTGTVRRNDGGAPPSPLVVRTHPIAHLAASGTTGGERRVVCQDYREGERIAFTVVLTSCESCRQIALVGGQAKAS